MILLILFFMNKNQTQSNKYWYLKEKSIKAITQDIIKILKINLKIKFNKNKS